MDEQTANIAFVFGASVAAGAINSVAGGGTLVSFPTLYKILEANAVEKAGLVANATNTMALWPASLISAWGFRKHKPPPGKLVLLFSIVSVAGGVIGAFLLKVTPTKQFDQIVPWLILMAALLFVFQGQIAKRLLPQTAPAEGDEIHDRGTSKGALFFQFCVGIYGGYFGAGIGIMMLAALSMLGLGDIHRLNYLKNIGALLINIIAAVMFGVWGLVDWKMAGVMAAGSVLGAICMSGIARRLGPAALRAIVSTVGICIAGVMLYKQFTK